MTYTYFISYSWSVSGNSGKGNTEVILTSKITSIDKIREIEDFIRKRDIDSSISIVILNFQLLYESEI